MLKPVIAATAALAIAGSSLVYAQQRFDGHGRFGNGGPRAEHRHRPSADDIAALHRCAYCRAESRSRT